MLLRNLLLANTLFVLLIAVLSAVGSELFPQNYMLTANGLALATLSGFMFWRMDQRPLVTSGLWVFTIFHAAVSLAQLATGIYSAAGAHAMFAIAFAWSLRQPQSS